MANENRAGMTISIDPANSRINFNYDVVWFTKLEVDCIHFGTHYSPVVNAGKSGGSVNLVDFLYPIINFYDQTITVTAKLIHGANGMYTSKVTQDIIIPGLNNYVDYKTYSDYYGGFLNNNNNKNIYWIEYYYTCVIKGENLPNYLKNFSFTPPGNGGVSAQMEITLLINGIPQKWYNWIEGLGPQMTQISLTYESKLKSDSNTYLSLGKSSYIIGANSIFIDGNEIKEKNNVRYLYIFLKPENSNLSVSRMKEVFNTYFSTSPDFISIRYINNNKQQCLNCSEIILVEDEGILCKFNFFNLDKFIETNYNLFVSFKSLGPVSIKLADTIENDITISREYGSNEIKFNTSNGYLVIKGMGLQDKKSSISIILNDTYNDFTNFEVWVEKEIPKTSNEPKYTITSSRKSYTNIPKHDTNRTPSFKVYKYTDTNEFEIILIDNGGDIFEYDGNPNKESTFADSCKEKYYGYNYYGSILQYSTNGGIGGSYKEINYDQWSITGYKIIIPFENDTPSLSIRVEIGNNRFAEIENINPAVTTKKAPLVSLRDGYLGINTNKIDNGSDDMPNYSDAVMVIEAGLNNRNKIYLNGVTIDGNQLASILNKAHIVYSNNAWTVSS